MLLLRNACASIALCQR